MCIEFGGSKYNRNLRLSTHQITRRQIPEN